MLRGFVGRSTFVYDMHAHAPMQSVCFTLLQRPFERKVNETMRRVACLQCDIYVIIRFTSGDNHGNAECFNAFDLEQLLAQISINTLSIIAQKKR